jgi:hypothetical protein
MTPSDLDKWNVNFYRELQQCPHNTKCRIGAGIGVNDVFIPLPPKVIGTIPRIIVLAMEPSGFGALNNNDAENQIANGKRCFWSHLGNMTLHYSIQEALSLRCGENNRYDYYITNLAKCSMKVKNAQKNRKDNYELCFTNVKKELTYILAHCDSIQPLVLTMGKEPYNFLQKKYGEDKSSLLVALPDRYAKISLQPLGFLLHNSPSKLHINIDNYWKKHGKPEGYEKILKTHEAKLKKFVQAYDNDRNDLEEAIDAIQKPLKLRRHAELAIVYQQQLSKIIDS